MEPSDWRVSSDKGTRDCEEHAHALLRIWTREWRSRGYKPYALMTMAAAAGIEMEFRQCLE
jgi:hypothetical protein